jgi:hypothetical protein
MWIAIIKIAIKWIAAVKIIFKWIAITIMKVIKIWQVIIIIITIMIMIMINWIVQTNN